MRANGPAIRARREALGMPPKVLAEKAGVKRSHLVNIELGHRQASPQVIKAIAQALNVSIYAIVGPEDEAAAKAEIAALEAS